MKNCLSLLLALLVTVPGILLASEPKAVVRWGEVRPDLCPGSDFRTLAVKSIDYMGFFRAQNNAIEAGATINDQVFEILVQEAAVGGVWSVKATYLVPPTLAAFEKDKLAMAALGKRWGADGMTSACASVWY